MSKKEISTKIIVKPPKKDELSPADQEESLKWLDTVIKEGKVISDERSFNPSNHNLE